jgi:hypothetical protein
MSSLYHSYICKHAAPKGHMQKAAIHVKRANEDIPTIIVHIGTLVLTIKKQINEYTIN